MALGTLATAALFGGQLDIQKIGPSSELLNADAVEVGTANSILTSSPGVLMNSVRGEVREPLLKSGDSYPLSCQAPAPHHIYHPFVYQGSTQIQLHQAYTRRSINTFFN